MADLAQQQEQYKGLIADLTGIVGDKFCLTDSLRTQRYRKGIFYGNGDALAVCRPGTLVEYYKVIKACVEAGVIVISQAQNTGVTGGSTPWGNDYDRPIVIVSTLRINTIHLINKEADAKEDTQAVCFAGSTLFELENKLREIGREPHSVIGSSCIGASVVGGICNNSGGTLVQRGPAYTELACYLQLHEDGNLEFINHLGLDLGEGTVEEQLKNLEEGNYKVLSSEGKLASSKDYRDIVNQVDEPSPSRFNSDPRRLKEASGSAGKLAIFAVRVDTFKKHEKTQLFYIGTNDPNELTEIRRTVLTKFDGLPIQGEYLSAEGYDDAVRFGKDTFYVLNFFGTQHLPKMFALKDWYDRKLGRLPFLPSANTALQFISDCLPTLLPKRIKQYRRKYEHYLILTTGDHLIEPTQKFLEEYLGREGSKGEFFVASADETKKALLLRFSVGGALARMNHYYRNQTAGMIALDVALRRNDPEWVEPMDEELAKVFFKRSSCGHFLCHVFHRDYLVKKGYDLEEIKEKLLANIKERGAQFPAEHNVGHLYKAQDTLVNHYKSLDPTNTFNPGIGKLPKGKNFTDCSCGCNHDADLAK